MLKQVSMIVMLIGFTIANAIEILSPLDKDIYQEEFASVSVKLTGNKVDDGSHIIITVNDEINYRIDIEKDRDTYCKSVKIKPGDNTIKISYYTSEGIEEEKKVSVFLYSPIFKEAEEPPFDYDEIVFHKKDNESRCLKCHDMTSLKPEVIPPSPESSPCYDCHKSLTSRARVHAPSANYVCNYCHYDSGKSYERYETPFPIADACFSCHEFRKKVWWNKKYIHGPTSTGQCNICHNPHSSDHLFFVKKPIWDLCTSCHSEKSSGVHVIAGFVYGKSHPTKGRPDPSRPGRELVCSSCHNPHGSNYKFFFNNDYTGDKYICTMCHKK
ncbi:cytochrome c3 family protein [Persephonella sp.]